MALFSKWELQVGRAVLSDRWSLKEPESELDAFHVSPEMIGAFSELAVHRYLNAKAKFDNKFSGV
jgi:hypothetical protein